MKAKHMYYVIQRSTLLRDAAVHGPYVDFIDAARISQSAGTSDCLIVNTQTIEDLAPYFASIHERTLYRENE